MPIEIKEVTTRKDLKTFVRFPYQLYRGNPCWVPLLDIDELNTLRRDRNPAFEHCESRYWLAYKAGRPVGRIAAILNRRHIVTWSQRYLRFGWVDFIDDPQVSAALFAVVEDWARHTGMTAVHGPLGFTDMDREGMLVEGFDQLGTLVTYYNHPYYPAHLEKLGYLKDTDWIEFEITMPEEPVEKIARAAKIIMQRNNLKLLEVSSKKELLNYAEEVFQILNDEYAHLYGVVPLTNRQVQQYIKQYFDYIQPDFVPIVLDENGRMVAFAIAMPSLSRAHQKAGGRLFPFGLIHLLQALRNTKRMDLYLVAVRSEYQGKGVNAILIDRMTRVFLKLGVQKIESNPELESNHRVQGQWKYFQSRQHKRRRCYIRHLEPSDT